MERPIRLRFLGLTVESNDRGDRCLLFPESTSPLLVSNLQICQTMSIQTDDARDIKDIDNGISVFQTAQYLAILVLLYSRLVRINDFEVEIFNATLLFTLRFLLTHFNWRSKGFVSRLPGDSSNGRCNGAALRLIHF